MKKYLRWTAAGIVVVALLVLLVFVGINSNLRNKITQLLAELKFKNVISDLKEQAANIRAKADADSTKAAEAEGIAKEIEVKIITKKKELSEDLAGRGMSTDEIAERFRKLSI